MSYWDFINITFPRAAKPYRCEECGVSIAVGEKHCYTAGKCEGDMMDYRLCLLCNELAQAWCVEFDGDEGWPMGDLRASIREEAGVEDVEAWLADFRVRDAERRAKLSAKKRGELPSP